MDVINPKGLFENGTTVASTWPALLRYFDKKVRKLKFVSKLGRHKNFLKLRNHVNKNFGDVSIRQIIMSDIILEGIEYILLTEKLSRYGQGKIIQAMMSSLKMSLSWWIFS